MKIKKLALVLSFVLPSWLLGSDVGGASDRDLKIKQLETELAVLSADHDFRAALKTSNSRLIAVNREHLDRVEAQMAKITLELQRLTLTRWEKPIDKP